MSERPDVLIVGAGFAGMYAIHRFRSQGLVPMAIEAGSDVGGTWYWNRYPGARCDVPSLEYSYGFSTELEQQWDWPEVFSAQPDILRYANHVADRFDLRRSIRFNTRVTALDYLETDNLWRLTTDSGETLEARYCVMATGCLSVPNTPEFPGADDFKGQVLHTGRWPKTPVDLSGKRVAIIGTGSSGVQAIPELAREARHLTVFQRTPVYTVPANRKAMRAEVQNEFRENYSTIRELQQNNAGGVSGFRPVKSTSRSERAADRTLSLPSAVPSTATSTVKRSPDDNRIGILDLTVAQRRQLVRQQGLGCKRQVLDRDYYDTFNRENVSLVDVRAAPIEAITERGLHTADAEYEFDVLVYATGFDAMTGALLKANITGRGDRRLTDKWEHGPVTYLGLALAARGVATL